MSTLQDVTTVWPRAELTAPAPDSAMNLCFVTGSESKLREIAAGLGVEVSRLERLKIPALREVQPEEAEYALMAAGRYEECASNIASDKSRRAFELAAKGVCVEDTGLYLPCEDGGPGPLIKSRGSPAQLAKLCRDTHASGDARASMVVAFAYFSGFGEPQVRVARVDGQIAESPRGKNGFGWDSIFIPDPDAQARLFSGQKVRTFAEMEDSEKAQLSARTRALTLIAQRPFQGPSNPPSLDLPEEAQQIARVDFKRQRGGNGVGASLADAIQHCRGVMEGRIVAIRAGLKTAEGRRHLVLTGEVPARVLDNDTPDMARVMPHFNQGRLHVLSVESAGRLLAREIFHMSLYLNHPLRLEGELRLLEAGYQPIAGKACATLEQAHGISPSGISGSRTASTFKEFRLEWEGGTQDDHNNERTPVLKVAGLQTWINRRDVGNFIMGGSMPAMSSSWGAATSAHMGIQTFTPCDGYFTPVDAQIEHLTQAMRYFREHPYRELGRFNDVRLSNGQTALEFTDERGMKRLGATVKARGPAVLPIVEQFMALGVTRFRVYDAGANRTIQETVAAIKDEYGDSVVLWAGNIKGLQQARECVAAGADGLIVGVAEGDQCSTADRANIAPDNPWALYELIKAGIPVPVGVDSGVGFHGPAVAGLGGSFAIRPQTLMGGTSTLRPVFIRDTDDSGNFFHPRNGEADSLEKTRGGEVDPQGETINPEGISGRAYWDHRESTAAHRVSSAEAGMTKGFRFARANSIRDLQHMPVAPIIKITGAAAAMAAPHPSDLETDDGPRSADAQFHPLIGRGSEEI